MLFFQYNLAIEAINTILLLTILLDSHGHHSYSITVENYSE